MDHLASESPPVRLMLVHPGMFDTAMKRKSKAAGLVLLYDDSELFRVLDIFM